MGRADRPTPPALPPTRFICRQRGNEIDGIASGRLHDAGCHRDHRGRCRADTERGLARSMAKRSPLTFTGKVSGTDMAGTLDMGEYLGATWTAKRRGRRMSDASSGASLLAVAVALHVGLTPAVASQEIRSAAPQRSRHRSSEQHQRHAGRGDLRRQDRRGGAHIDPAELHRASMRPGCTSRPGSSTFTRTCTRARARRILRRRSQRLSRTLRAAVGRHHRRGCRRLGLAEFRGLQAAHHRSLDDARAGLPEHRRQRDARGKIRAGSRGHGGAAGGRHGAPLSRPHRRHQDGALLRPGVDTGRARRRSGHAGGYPGDGGLRLEQAGAAARRAA